MIMMAVTVHLLSVVMEPVIQAKPMRTAQKIAPLLVNVMMVMFLTALTMIAAQSLGLVMVLKTVKIKHMAVT